MDKSLAPLIKRLAMGLLFALSGICCVQCVTVKTVSISQIPAKSERVQKVSAHTSSPAILWIPFGTSYIDQARSELLAQCATGRIEGLVTKQEVTNYFFTLYETNSMTMRGYCLQGGDERPVVNPPGRHRADGT